MAGHVELELLIHIIEEIQNDAIQEEESYPHLRALIKNTKNTDVIIM